MSNSNSSAGSPAGGASAGTDPKGDVIKAYRLRATKSYRLHETTTMSGPGGSQTFARVLEVVPPDRFHAVLDPDTSPHQFGRSLIADVPQAQVAQDRFLAALLVRTKKPG